jgi:hypothetical protein
MGPILGARRRVRLLLPAFACLYLLALAPPAFATFHEMSIREVYPGSLAEPGAQYVELQMWAGGQNHVKTHVLRSYNATGTVIATNTFGSDVPGGANQSTIVMATPEAEAKFGIVADGPLSPSGQLDPAGGAICWENLDCVAWGNFSGSSLPSPEGSPAASPAGIPDGMALRRTIAPGCAMQLEPTDDRDNSAADFSAVFPEPRPNSVAPSERACASTGEQQQGGTDGPTGNQGGRGAPQTTLKRKPPHKTHDRTPTFRFTGDEAGSTFQCKLDSKPFRTCHSPFTTAKLRLGQHRFQVRAIDESGRLDPTPATYSFRLTKPA